MGFSQDKAGLRAVMKSMISLLFSAWFTLDKTLPVYAHYITISTFLEYLPARDNQESTKAGSEGDACFSSNLDKDYQKEVLCLLPPHAECAALEFSCLIAFPSDQQPSSHMP